MSIVVDSPRYPTLNALTSAHRDLLVRYRANRSDGLLRQVESFLLDARFTGSVLDDEHERTVAQSVLDYWIAALYRANRPPLDVSLTPYDPPAVPTLEAATSPYPGLAAFDEAASERFGGRQRFVEELCGRLRTSRFVSIVGPRGSGKSSILRAGLLPALKRGALEDSKNWQYMPIVIPDGAPLERLARALGQSGSDPLTVTPEADAFRRDPTLLGRRLRDVAAATGHASLLVIDQFEDLLPRPGEKVTFDADAFLSNLLRLITSDVLCTIVILRTDDRIDPEFNSAELLFDDAFQAVVPDMGTAELRDAIQRPADAVGLRFEPGIVDDLVRALVGAPIQPPLLQFVMAQLWERREHGRVTWASYLTVVRDPKRRRTNVGWTVANTAQAMYDELAATPLQQAAMKRILLRLVGPAGGSDLVLRRLTWDDVCRDDEDPASASVVLHKLVAARLVRVADDGDVNASRVEAVHPALARQWTMLDQWLADVRVAQARRLRLQAAVKEWLDHKKAADGLWGDALLRDAHDFGQLSPAEKEFMDRSRAAVRLQKRLQLLWRAGVVLVVLLLAAGVLAYKSLAASASRALVTQAGLAAESQPDLGLLYAVAGYRLDPGAQSRFGVIDALQRSSPLVAMLAVDSDVTQVAASPDGSLLAAVHGSTIDVWDGHTFQRYGIALHAPVADGANLTPITGIVFSPEAAHRRLAASLNDGRIQIWDLSDGQPLGPPLTTPPAPGSSLAFRPGSGNLVAFNFTTNATLEWNSHMAMLQSHVAPRRAFAAALTPDGNVLATIICIAAQANKCTDYGVNVRETTSDTSLWTADTRRPDMPVLAVSPDGTTVALGRMDGTVDLWERYGSDGQLRTTLTPNLSSSSTGKVSRIAFRSDNKELAVALCASSVNACLASDLYVWSIRSGMLSPRLATVPTRIPSLTFVPESSLLMTGRWSSVALLDSGRRSRMEQPNNLTQSGRALQQLGDGRLAAGDCNRLADQPCAEGKVRLIDPRVGAGQEEEPLMGHAPWVVSLASSADGKLLASEGSDGSGIAWDLATREQVAAFTLPEQSPNLPGQSHWVALAISGDGLLAAGGPSVPTQLIRRGSIESLDQAPHANSLALDATGKRLAIGTPEGFIEILDLDAKNSTRLPERHIGAAQSLAFSRDGRLLASGWDDGTVLIWDVETGQRVGNPLLGHQNAVVSLAFDDAGQLISIDRGSDTRSTIVSDLRLESTEFDDVLTRACQVASRNLTTAEWDSAHTFNWWRIPVCPQNGGG